MEEKEVAALHSATAHQHRAKPCDHTNLHEEEEAGAAVVFSAGVGIKKEIKNRRPVPVECGSRQPLSCHPQCRGGGGVQGAQSWI